MNTDIEAVVEEFKRLGGDDDFLESTDKKDLPEPNLTRGYNWPETRNELDPDSIIDWLRTALSKAKEETARAIFSGATIELDGKFYKISDADAYTFLTNNNDN